ncbi:OSBPL9_10_11 [Lepeophtheirus salmonis]|uniref:OSBPL9_10_11 n=1 Tax=Lepeophtheirus salmonis TaxID=72036 RepID=A0A7R8CK02_LEPSM|nr:OSBPL9_10_11 [Lepeophtheirus salmonis]CAF2846043.1 OSBPL9_10_11 [Lepeophtheirus salmonis]
MSSVSSAEVSVLCPERRAFEGQLNKFTNLVKGWQYRWMILDPETGTLSYYTSAEDKYDRIPRLFSVDFASGETFKLRASNVKERQIWVDKLRSVAQSHDKALTAVNSASPPIREYLPPTPPGSKSHLRHNGEPNEALQNLSLTVLDALGSAHDILHQCNSSLSLQQDNGSSSSTPLTSSKLNTESPTKSTGSFERTFEGKNKWWQLTTTFSPEVPSEISSRPKWA